MASTYLLATRPVSTSFLRKCLLRFEVLGELRCFLPAWGRFSLPLALTRKRLTEPLCVFILGMVVTQNRVTVEIVDSPAGRSILQEEIVGVKSLSRKRLISAPAAP